MNQDICYYKPGFDRWQTGCGHTITMAAQHQHFCPHCGGHAFDDLEGKLHDEQRRTNGVANNVINPTKQ